MPSSLEMARGMTVVVRDKHAKSFRRQRVCGIWIMSGHALLHQCTSLTPCGKTRIQRRKSPMTANQKNVTQAFQGFIGAACHSCALTTLLLALLASLVQTLTYLCSRGLPQLVSMANTSLISSRNMKNSSLLARHQPPPTQHRTVSPPLLDKLSSLPPLTVTVSISPPPSSPPPPPLDSTLSFSSAFSLCHGVQAALISPHLQGPGAPGPGAAAGPGASDRAATVPGPAAAVQPRTRTASYWKSPGPRPAGP
eukprot:756068-Hanusia_phi.AAC.4